MDQHRMVLAGGWCLLIFAFLFIGISIGIDLMTIGHFPQYSLSNAGLFHVMPAKNFVYFLLSLYAVIPFLLIPAAVGTYYLFADRYEASLRVAVLFGTIGATCLVLSLMLLPSLSWLFLTYTPILTGQSQGVAILTLRGMYNYFGIYVGDIAGLGCLVVWLAITSVVAIRSSRLPAAVGWGGIIVTALIVVTLLLRFTIAPNIISYISLGNLLALWSFIFGIGLISLRRDKTEVLLPREKTRPRSLQKQKESTYNL